MAHGRTQIRTAVTALLTASAPVGTSVKTSRVWPTAQADLPRYNVYTTGDDIDDRFGSMGIDGHLLTLIVDILDSAPEATLQDVMDAHAAVVESTLVGQSYGGKAVDTNLTTTTITAANDGDVPLGVTTLTFEVIYRTLRGDPETLV